MTEDAQEALAEMARLFTERPPAWTENDTIPKAVAAYLKLHPEGLPCIERLCMSPNANAIHLDVVEALGQAEESDPLRQGRAEAAQRLLLNAPSVAVRDSAMLALCSLDLPGTASVFRRAAAKETNKTLREDLLSAADDAES